MVRKNDLTGVSKITPTVETVTEHRIEWTDDGCRYRLAETETPSEAVITAVNICLERDGQDLSLVEQTPLYNAVDPEALDRLFSLPDSPSQQVSFTYQGYDVKVTSDDAVHLAKNKDIGNGSR